MSTIFLNNDDELYQALCASSHAYDGHIFVCVKTTGIFCRLSCKARKPLQKNVFFADNAASCLEQGFRPCTKCKPLQSLSEKDPCYLDLMQRLESNPDHIWSEEDISALGYELSTVRRIFKRTIGMTFLDLARLKRASKAAAQLSAGDSVINTQLETGYESSSGFRDAIIRLIGEPPQALKNRTLLKAKWIDTPIGQMLAVADNQFLHLLEFFDRKGLPNELKKLQLSTKSAIEFANNEILDRLSAELDAYFSGQSCMFKTPLALHGSPFTANVWRALQEIPNGTTCSYAALAKDIERPTAMRAVARANGQNQIAIIIPCHRVIGSDGSLTGYAGGLWRKDWLLNHEKRFFS
ncbi:bifunctional transcriptional activator/DNA repair enzyme AdaA [Bartonella sp. HY406]|uniref:bifunctional transcriptional activator/DNA repair enzyme AdaA n=1 Tax=Bartonella sp. HY406 TaxID=2979331 RepID=UPI0021C76F8D|nr:trifunctional transcriptional activator/DNA repair protein Ada/methylated-DNA--[protein]-cysteine S-methyltransferase [Bartonella sp. HY406]UXN03205.1 trifunctional transcriptional activator/DNA repair protein Ada/methylated-DNA--[protein]-cysteine S-methyltransferase [Bartonella sp. HY406]